MSQRLDNKLLLNRHALQQLQRAGLAELGQGLPDISAAHRFALWNKRSGAEVYLFALLNSATRQTALHYFSRLGLRPGIDMVKVADQRHSAPELAGIYRLFPEFYPNQKLEQAKEPDDKPSRKVPRLQLLAELFLLETLTDNLVAQPFRALFDDAGPV
jgi:hypothetical protein